MSISLRVSQLINYVPSDVFPDVFKIEPPGKLKATIDKGQGYNWIWHVTPIKKVDSTLVLTIYLNGDKPVRQLTEQIQVEPSTELWKDLLDNTLTFIEKHPLLSALIGSGGLGGLLLRYLKKKE